MHKVASMYGRDKSAKYIENIVNYAEVRYADEQKARRVQRRLQLLEANTVYELLDKAIVLKDDGNVNVFNTKKGYSFIRSRGLQLPISLTNMNNLSASDIKTEKYLIQYKSKNSNK